MFTCALDQNIDADGDLYRPYCKKLSNFYKASAGKALKAELT
ncbi:hypothetical protein ALQ57_101389 [Pseudomonas amygdali pv. hibisci]|uniref:Uncharacterized protein n=1 Tax=Pseudomonas amygdali pv. hibisci TaxID=251723 RepID=A0AB34TZ81_PSEA0|nr:hypothetical protein ALO67_101367 [Pseudomonas amygdali pv. hibisci]RMN62005.1 hypothetical protein ALQ57_101389 [Pseudomonas amygdali pv. hibisci]